MQTAYCRNGMTRLPAALLAAGFGLLLGGSTAPTGGAPGVRAFVLSNIFFASPLEPGACKIPSDGALETYFKMLPAGEQAKYATQDKRQALAAALSTHFGFRRLQLRPGDFGGRSTAAKLPPSLRPGQVPTPAQLREIAALNGFPPDRGSLAFRNQVIAYSACTNPADFPALAEGYRPYDGKLALGMDLDGKSGEGDFTGPTGERGVDNQLWHVIGCTKTFAEQGDPRIAKNIMLSAGAPTIIELRGAATLDNAADVTVNLYASADPLQRDGRGGALAFASFRLDPDRSLRATTHGRIKDGVLTTDPVDLKFNFKEQIIDSPRVIRAARLRMVFKPDGSVEGEIAGYYTLTSFYDSIEQMTQDGANVSGISCPGYRDALDSFADGFRDPATGRFTAISSEMSFFGVPAFAVEESRMAGGDTARQSAGASP